MDNADFRDVVGQHCEGWHGRDCLEAAQWYPQDPQKLVEYCLKSCGFCKSKVVINGTSKEPTADTNSSRRLIKRGITIQSVVCIFGTTTRVQARCVDLQGIDTEGLSSAPMRPMLKMPCPLESATQAKTLTVAPQEEMRTAVSATRKGHARLDSPWGWRSCVQSRYECCTRCFILRLPG
jgi:hypothetical protein